ncbi:hybrid sensor histidine kinase/response regulator [Acidovorax sp. GW101-3H11]|uniref:hybrid sensor histidine kinase/response regulator n=1 Tax=Acidovorax sp. GW101-3H11 TaxID=1813946 RepID=UPI0007B537DB|nr:hybrid sensor histidine kinase/response regulator [Acidovorax sp. GW101-3H11]KZT17532.1 hybrid sensor histidine kinase/response regulator [Acidovorax sp. GW101-3H11]
MTQPAPAAAAVDAEALDALYRGAPMAALVGVVEAFFLSVLFWRDVPAASIAGWLLAFAAVRGLRIGLGLAYRRAGALQPGGHAFWARWVVASAMAQALAWGAGSWVLLAPHNVVAEMALHIGLAAVVLGSVAHLAHHLPALAAYAAGVFGPLALRDVLVGQPLHYALALASVLMAWYVWRSGRAQAHALAQASAQRQEKLALIDALQRENEATRQARADAEAAHASKARFLATIGHDLRQPLNALGLLSHTLRQAPTAAAPERVQALSGAIAECVGSMGALVEGLLELSRLDARTLTPRPTAFALQGLFDEMTGNFAAMAQERGLDLQVATTPATVWGDRALLARVLSNLVSNAIRYTPTGFVRVDAVQEGSAITVGVHDSGVGMEAAELPRIFDEYYQIDNPQRNRTQGLGLGLATAKRLSDLLGLDLSVHSIPGQGSSFSLRLPVAEPTPAAPLQAPPAEATPTPLAGRRILVLEDDADSRQALCGLLASWGCAVVEASDLAAALALLPGAGTAAAPIDALVVDLRLPGADDGMAAIARLREALGSPVPALLVTADAHQAEVQQRATAAGLPLLSKPIAPMKLRAFLQSHLPG